MDSVLQEFLKSGKTIIKDTKVPKQKEQKRITEPLPKEKQSDPHSVFVKRTVDNKPKKAEVLEDFKTFITEAEKDL